MDDGEPRAARGSHKKWWIALAVVVALVIAGGLYLVLSRNSVEKRLAAIREAGYPTNFAELAEYNKLPEGVKNAAGLYEEAFYSLVELERDANVPLFSEVTLPDRGEALPEEMAEAISRCLEENQKCLGLLRKAGGIEHCRYTWDYSGGTPSHLRETRECARLLHLAAVLRAHEGDAEAAVAFMKDGLRLADSHEGEPFLINHLVRVACIAVPLSSLERVLSTTPLAEDHLRDLRDMMARMRGSIDLTEVLVMERCFMIECFSNPAPQAGLGGGHTILNIPIIGKMGLIDLLDYFRDCIEASKLDGTERKARFQEIEKEVEELSFLHTVIKVFAPAMSRIGVVDLKIQGHLDLAQAATAIERYRLAEGKLPGRLEELVGEYLEEVPIDPFNGKPIKYKRTEPGYVLYSIGEDCEDNGGVERDKEKRDQPWDVTFIVPR